MRLGLSSFYMTRDSWGRRSDRFSVPDWDHLRWPRGATLHAEGENQEDARADPGRGADHRQAWSDSSRSRYVARLREGETILLCRRNEPGAEIRALPRARNERRPIRVGVSPQPVHGPGPGFPNCGIEKSSAFRPGQHKHLVSIGPSL